MTSQSFLDGRVIPMVTRCGKPVDTCEQRAQLNYAGHSSVKPSYNVKHDLQRQGEAVDK